MPRSEASPAKAVQDEARLHALVDKLTFGERRAPQDEPAAFDVPLVSHALVGVGSDPATSWAIEWAEALGPVFHPRVTLVHVEVPSQAYPGMWAAPAVPEAIDAQVAQEKAGLRLVDDAATRLRHVGLEVAIRQRTGSAVRELTRAAREENADLVIVGSPSHSALDRFLLGSVADGVKNHADTNVLLAKAPPVPGDVLCPVDGSWGSKRAAALALRFARAWGSALHVLHVVEPPPAGPPTSTKAQLDALRGELALPWRDLPGVEFRLVVGEPAVEIAREAERMGARLIVMGHRGLGGLRSLVVGSVANYVTHHVAQSLLLVKGPKPDPSAPSFAL